MSENYTENGHSDSDPKRKWRKKRKNFLSNAKKYGKKGQLGRGTKMPEELYQYLVGILEAIKKGIEDEEERHTLVTNVLERTKGDEINIVSNQLGSRVIEILLPYASAEDLERFTEVIDPHLRPMASDNFTSHIIETLLRVSCTRATDHLQNTLVDEEVPIKKIKREKKYSDEHVKKCYDYTLKICKYVANNLEDFVWDQYANHILRSALKSLSGITLLPGEKPKLNQMAIKNVDDTKGIPPHTMKMEYREVPEEFKDLVKEFAGRLATWPQFKDLPYKNTTSALLQVLLYAVKNVDKNITKDLVRKLLDEAFAPEGWVSTGADDKKDTLDVKAEDEKPALGLELDNLPPVFQSQSAVRLLEAALFVAKKKTYTQLYARCFLNRLAKLASVPMLNFTVQRLFDNCTVKEELEPMFEELSPHLSTVLACGNSGVLVALGKACHRLGAKQAHFLTELSPHLSTVLACGNSGVLVALGKACHRLGAKQAHFLTSLEAALNCSEAGKQKYFSIACLRLTPLDKLDVTSLDREYFIHVHGSVILQAILDFQRPGKAVNSLLELEGEQLVVILCDAKGSHIADALCSGQHVGVKARDKLIWRLKGYYQKMALSQYGSRAFEKIFAAASPEQKVKIMSELADKSSLLNATQFGKLIADKLDVAAFKVSQKKWEESWKRKCDNK